MTAVLLSHDFRWLLGGIVACCVVGVLTCGTERR